jgi:O-antigen/teichoic acid export membrane protein
MATLILYASDNFIIAQLFTPAEVTIYNIAFKYFSVASIFFTIVLAPFWSMTTQAQEEGDWKWIRSAVKKLTALWVFLLIGGLVQLAVATPIYKFWTTNKILVPLQLSIVMFIYFLVSNWGSIYSNFINGIGKIKIQLVTATMGMIFNIPLAIFLVKFCHIGVIGVPVATIITMGGANIASMVQYRKIVNNTARGIWNK